MEAAPLEGEWERLKSGWESDAGLRLRSRLAPEEDEGRRAEDEASLSLRFPCPDAPSLKMCIVSVAEETHRREEAALKDMLKIREGMDPRRN